MENSEIDLNNGTIEWYVYDLDNGIPASPPICGWKTKANTVSEAALKVSKKQNEIIFNSETKRYLVRTVDDEYDIYMVQVAPSLDYETIQFPKEEESQ